MAWNTHNIGFHLAMYSSYWGLHRDIISIPGEALKDMTTESSGLRVHFWTPGVTAGSMFIVDNVMPRIQAEADRLNFKWTVTQGPDLPKHEVDRLICFKATPPAHKIVGNPQKIMLICDQAEVHWKDLPTFDEIVTTSSKPFARVVAWRHAKVFFISEFEPDEHLAFGEENLATSVADRENVLLWHGGKHSLMALEAMRPVLESWARTNSARLHVVCGPEPERRENWGPLEVCFFPWSPEQMRRSAKVARLGIVPAKRRLKLSWLKPASRVRCLYALGVPAIGDRRAPDVQEFNKPFGGPSASGHPQWRSQLQKLWNDPAELQRLATAGHVQVQKSGTAEIAARKWIRFLARKSVSTR
jgi:hypothetical protein